MTLLGDKSPDAATMQKNQRSMFIFVYNSVAKAVASDEFGLPNPDFD